MSDDDKGFLSRWSQRKHEAKQPEPKPDAPLAEPDQAPQQVAKAEAEPEFDLSSLPKLEDMTGTTDITAFLKKGVPESLRNAALRKSWALDPAIRNYVNPALEYAYDWNTPGGVPGNSELGAGIDVARMVSQIMGDGESAAEPAAAAAETGNQPAGDPAPSGEPQVTPESKPELPTQALRLGNEPVAMAEAASNDEESASFEAGQTAESQKDSVAPQQPVRRHGSAKPLD
jgi:hypothetical protein